MGGHAARGRRRRRGLRSRLGWCPMCRHASHRFDHHRGPRRRGGRSQRLVGPPGPARPGYARCAVPVACLAVLVASGRHNRRTDSQGALETIVRQPFGHALVLASGLGFGAYALWQLAIAVMGNSARGGSDSGVGVALTHALVYAFFGVTTGSGAGRASRRRRRPTGGGLDRHGHARRLGPLPGRPRRRRHRRWRLGARLAGAGGPGDEPQPDERRPPPGAQRAGRGGRRNPSGGLCGRRRLFDPRRGNL